MSLFKRSLFSTLVMILLVGAGVIVRHSTAEAITPLSKGCSVSGASASAVCQDKSSGDRISGSNGLIAKIFTWVVRIVGAVSVIMVIVGGIKYMVSGGDASQVKSAKDTIIYALVGLLVAGLAGAIVRFTLGSLSL